MKRVITSEGELKSGGRYGKWYLRYSKRFDKKSYKGAEPLRIPNKEYYLCRYDKNAKAVASMRIQNEIATYVGGSKREFGNMMNIGCICYNAFYGQLKICFLG